MLLLAAAAVFAAGGAAQAQGTVSTTDGLSLSLSAAGSVSSLRLSGVERASTSVSPSGFVWRELPASASSSAPNGSFESGAPPTSWSWANDSYGTWSLDATTMAAGTRSMKVSIPGSTNRHSPVLTSSQFSIAPNTTYTMTYGYRTSGLVGSLTVYVLEQDSSGKWVQRGVAGKTGTNGWSSRTLSFTSSPIAVRAYFKAEIYSGRGTAWLDDLRLEDAFAGRRPAAFSGSVSSDAGGMTQTASASGLTLSARFTSVGAAIKVVTTLTDTTASDRPIEVSFQLPVDVPGWTWDTNPVTSSAIVSGTRYENLDSLFGAQSHSIYPLATVHSLSSAVAMAVPMGPQMQRFAYDTEYGLRSTWDLGLSAAALKMRSKATFTFWIYTHSARWGFRSAAEKYYALNPSSFTSSATLNGAWTLPSRLSLDTVPNPQDFGWGFVNTLSEIEFANSIGLTALHYVDPSGWFRNFPGYTTQPGYSTLVSALNSDATTGTGTTVDATPVKEMAQAVKNSSPFDPNGLYQVNANIYFWYGNRAQIYPVSPDADIPAPSMWSVLTRYSIDNQLASQQGRGNTLNGIFLDDITRTFGRVENHRRSLWAYSDVPLTFSYATRKVMLYDGFSTGEFCGSLRSYVKGKGLVLGGSLDPASYSWFASSFDVLAGEAPGADTTERTYARRVLGYGRPWSNLLVNNTSSSAPDASKVLAYLRQALAVGYFPGFAGEYWNSPSAYERDRSLVKKYVGLIRKVVSAGWKPVNYATSSSPLVYLERFDSQSGSVFYVTAQNNGTSTASPQITLDGAGLGITASDAVTVKELVGATAVSVSRSGANVLFSDSLAPGETALYEITAAGGGAPLALPANGSFEAGAGSPAGWTLGTSSFDGNWTWDPTGWVGSRSAKLVVSGTSLRKSPPLTSATFAVLPGKSYTFSVSLKTSGAGGAYAPAMYFVELDAAGNILKSSTGASLQHGISASFGTSAWTTGTATFTTDPRCARGYVYANIYNGYGTFWVDDVMLR